MMQVEDTAKGNCGYGLVKSNFIVVYTAAMVFTRSSNNQEE